MGLFGPIVSPGTPIAQPFPPGQNPGGDKSSGEQITSPEVKTDPTAIDYASKGIGSNKWSNESYLSDMLAKAQQGDEAAQQWLANYYSSEDSLQKAMDWTAQREDTAYQRLVSDLQKAGISPYILSGATPSVSSASGRSYSGTEMVSKANNERTTKTSEQNAYLQSILRIAGVVGSALIYALMA